MHDIWKAGAGLVETMCRSEPESQIDAILRAGQRSTGDYACSRQAVHPHNDTDDQASGNRHSQQWTPADIHGRSVPGHVCCGAGSPHRNLASGRRNRARQVERSSSCHAAHCAVPAPETGKDPGWAAVNQG